ncbi:MAG: RNA 2',3'-cyclic phosphodiesterase, partial [Limisphaerales bacterium]
KFLGDVPETQIGALGRAVRAVADTAAPMRLRAEGTGFFPNDRSPRVFWMDIKSADGRLMEFQGQLEAGVQTFAQKQDAKKFTAHVTLARMGTMRRQDTETLTSAAAVARTFGEWTATEARLIQSSLLASGPVYAVLDTFRIKNV